MYEQAVTLLVAYGPILAVAVLAWWLMLYFLDWRGHIHFRRAVLPRILENSLGAGLYFGLRCIAVAILVYAALGAVRF